MKSYERVLVACPGDALTAGPEALHQFVAELNRQGQPAAIVYYPFDREFSTPLPYRVHGAPVARYAQEPGTLIVFPEVYTTLALRAAPADAAIWWMSVNNFTGVRYENALRDRLRYWKWMLKGAVPFGGVKALAHLRHFAQCDYARDFLAGHGVRSEPLHDPIPVYTDLPYQQHLPSLLAQAKRADRILYNPRKGARVTRRLIAAYPRWEFRPLQGLDRSQLALAFLGAKLYIDFGHHPGRDRLPREAALHGCCVITARHGSAGNDIDVPLPSRFKLDVKAPDFIQQFGKAAGEVMANFDSCSAELEGYRRVIAREPDVFREQVRAAFVQPAD